MTKYLLGIVSMGASLLIGTAAFADSYSIQVLNLPGYQQPNKMLTLDLALSSSFEGDNQNATLQVDDCGNGVAVSSQGYVRQSLPLTLLPNDTQKFPLTIYRESNEECILTFKLFNESHTLLTSTQIGVMPQCPDERAKKPIDEGLDYTLPEVIEAQTSQPTSSTSSTPSTPRKTSSVPTKIIPAASLLSTTDDELNTAFDLLIAKGLLTTGDKAKLKQPLTRMAAAELFVQVAVSKGLKFDSEKTCKFLDMTDASADEVNVATLACQLNIMGVNPDYTPLANFMPNLTIPSEQLVTAFSRLMWRDLYERPESGAYYELHMNTMLNLGLIDQKVIKADSTLADFVVIIARAFDQEQLIVENVESIDLECETGDEGTGTCDVKEEKRGFWFW